MSTGGVGANVSWLDNVAESQGAVFVGDAWHVDFVQSRRDAGSS